MELLRDPDADLIAACRDPNGEGFEQAFGQLFDRYRDRVYAIAYRVLGHAGDALDVTQESFALVFRKLALFRGGSLFSTWLFRIVVNCSIDFRRKSAPKRALRFQPTDETAAAAVPDDRPGPGDRAVASEVSSQVQQAMGELSPKLRAILALRYLEDMSYEELAVTLGLSLGTVKSRLARAHLALEIVVKTRFPQLDRSAEVPDSLGGVG